MDMGVANALRENMCPARPRTWSTVKFPSIRNSFEMENNSHRKTPRSKDHWVPPGR